MENSTSAAQTWVAHMKFNTMTPEQKERAFAEDVLGWVKQSYFDAYEKGDGYLIAIDIFRPLTNLDHAFLGVDKLIDKADFNLEYELNKWSVWFINVNEGEEIDVYVEANTPNEAITEACLRITNPGIFNE